MLPISRFANVSVKPCEKAYIVDLCAETSRITVSEDVSIKVSDKPVPRSRVSISVPYDPFNFGWVRARIVTWDADDAGRMVPESDLRMAMQQVRGVSWDDLHGHLQAVTDLDQSLGVWSFIGHRQD